MTQPILLTDSQIQQFICDGYLILKPSVEANIHKTIDDKFNWLAENEPNPGNNILARLPELNTILTSPEVEGAMISLLGENYITCTHCFWHTNQQQEPISEEKLWNRVKEGSHQDNYCPSSMGKSHQIQYIRFMYYSHDLDVKNGPTHVSPGTQYNSEVYEEDRENMIPVIGEAGTVFISHFEMIHGASRNISNRVRNMIKFLFTRKNVQHKPNWNHQNSKWVTPSKIQSPYTLHACWENQWNWLSGKKELLSPKTNHFEVPAIELSEDKLNKFIKNIEGNPEAIEFLLSKLNTSSHSVRNNAIYALVQIGEPAISPVVNYIENLSLPANLDLRMPTNTISFDDATQVLISMGAPVLSHISVLFKSTDEWVLLNTLHLLNVIGVGNQNICTQVKGLLNNESNNIVAWATTALGSIGSKEQVEVLLDILSQQYDRENHDSNVDDSSVLTWPAEWIIHFNASLGLVRLSNYAETYEDRISSFLGHPFAQVDMMLCQCLRRIGTVSALEKVCDYLQPHMWDHSLKKGRNF
jgi:HEAT repeat protein